MLTGDENAMEKAEMTEVLEEKQEESNDFKSNEENDSMQKLVKLLQERLTIYEIAEQKAKRENESGRARRFNRGVRTLKEMLTSAQSGRGVDEADIPPPLPSSATTESTEKENTSKTYFFSCILFYISI